MLSVPRISSLIDEDFFDGNKKNKRNSTFVKTTLGMASKNNSSLIESESISSGKKQNPSSFKPTSISNANAKEDSSKFLQGEELSVIMDGRCQAFNSVYKGKIIITSYQVIFAPSEPAIFKKKNMRPDFFKIPHGMISRYIPYHL